jgi:hypothetical protein
MTITRRLPIIIITTFTIISGAIYMYFHNQNQMAVNVLDTTVEDLSRPWKKTYFDASEWLNQKDRYIKIDDFHLIDLNFRPMEIRKDSYQLFRSIQRVIKADIALLDGLEPLANMSDELGNFDFYRAIYATNLQAAYLYTDFNDETFKPTSDYFLIRFAYNNEFYEIYLEREPYDLKKYNDTTDMYYSALVARKGKDSIREYNPKMFAYEAYVTKHNLPNRNEI